MLAPTYYDTINLSLLRISSSKQRMQLLLSQLYYSINLSQGTFAWRQPIPLHSAFKLKEKKENKKSHSIPPDSDLQIPIIHSLHLLSSNSTSYCFSFLNPHPPHLQPTWLPPPLLQTTLLNFIRPRISVPKLSPSPHLPLPMNTMALNFGSS